MSGTEIKKLSEEQSGDITSGFGKATVFESGNMVTYYCTAPGMTDEEFRYSINSLRGKCHRDLDVSECRRCSYITLEDPSLEK